MCVGRSLCPTRGGIATRDGITVQGEVLVKSTCQFLLPRRVFRTMYDINGYRDN